MFQAIITKLCILLSMPLLFLFAIVCRIARKTRKNPNLLWGVEGLINNAYFANALKDTLVSHSLAINVFKINKAENFDIVIKSKRIKYVWCIFYVLYKYDIHHISFNGGLLGALGFGWLEPLIFKLAGIKVITIAYGSDVHVYDHIKNSVYAHTLMSFYPVAAKRRNKIIRQVQRWCKYSDFVIPAMFLSNGFPKWDVVTPNTLVIDSEKYSQAIKREKKSTIKVVHTPNHRIIKGSEYIVEAVNNLKKEGLDIELVLLEKMPNDQVMKILLTEADILVEKLVGPSYALSGIEGMACGLPVISNINTDDWAGYMKLFYRYSFLGECPIVSANVDTIEEVLRALYKHPELRERLGEAGIAYVNKYHSYKSARYFFEKVYESLWYGNKTSFMNFYHPLKSLYVKSNKINNPLHRNRLSDKYLV